MRISQFREKSLQKRSVGFEAPGRRLNREQETKMQKKFTEVHTKGLTSAEIPDRFHASSREHQAQPKPYSAPIIVVENNKKPALISSVLHAILVSLLPKKAVTDLSRLDKYLQDRELRDEIVNQLLSSHSADGSTKVRFVTAVNDYQHTKNENEKKLKAMNIVALFIQEGSKFQIQGIPRVYEKDMVKCRFKNLLIIKELILRELLKNAVVVEFLKSAEAHTVEHNPLDFEADD